MRKARLYENGLAEWIEVCFCSTPLQEEKPYWEEYFDLIEIKDAAKRKPANMKTEKIMELHQLPLHGKERNGIGNNRKFISGKVI